VPFGNIESCA